MDTKREGVLRIRVRDHRGVWVALPFIFYYGSDRVGVGDKPIKSHKDYETARTEARRILKQLQSQNPGHRYEIDE